MLLVDLLNKDKCSNIVNNNTKEYKLIREKTRQ